MKMTLKERIGVCSDLYREKRRWPSEWDCELMYNSAAAAGSLLTRRENIILMDRVNIKGTPLYNQKPDDCEINYRLKKAYLLVNRYMENHFDMSPGRMKKLLDTLLVEGLDEKRWDDYHWYNNVNSTKLRNKLREINKLRENAFEGMSLLGKYDVSFEVLYKFGEILGWKGLEAVGGKDRLARLFMYWVQRENGLLPALLPSAGDDLAEYKKLMFGEVHSLKGSEDFRLFMRRLLENSISQFPKGKSMKGEVTSKDRILELVEIYPRHTAKTMAACLGLSEKGVHKQIALLKAEGRLMRVGPDKGGYWQICRPLHTNKKGKEAPF